MEGLLSTGPTPFSLRCFENVFPCFTRWLGFCGKLIADVKGECVQVTSDEDKYKTIMRKLSLTNGQDVRKVQIQRTVCTVC